MVRQNLPIRADYNPTVRPWYKQAVQMGKPVATTPYIDMVTNKLVVSFVSPVVSGSSVKGVLGSDVTMENVIANVRSISPTPASFGVLIDKTGVIIAHPDENLTLKNITDIAPGVVLSELLTAQHPVTAEMGGAERMVRAAPIAGTDWYILVALDREKPRRACVHC